MNRASSNPAYPLIAAEARAWLGETFHGVTWKRFGVFCLLAGWMALGSWPTGDAIWDDGRWSYVARQFLVQFAMYTLTYGAPTLAVVAIGNRFGPDSKARIPAFIVAVALGSLIAATVAALIFPQSRLPDLFEQIIATWFECMLEIGMIGFVILFLARRDEAHASVHREQLDRIALDRELAEARLQALQSQIEPHFLFNTLANIRRLLQTDRVAGKSMLHQFSSYVESTLLRLRNSQSSLGRELALTSAYLNVQQIRMGRRLTTRVDVPVQLELAAFPPMMLMTLVENAIKHGLAPLPQGGCISIVAGCENGVLTVRVEDSGIGLKPSSGAGIGIANTRARLQVLFGSRGRLRISENAAGGVTAAIDVPLDIASAQGMSG